MKMPTVSIVFGTRPEAIKLAPVILALRQRRGLQCRVCVAAQHREMLDPILTFFRIPPDTDLNIMTPNQGLGALTARLIRRLDSYFHDGEPDLVLVQGDTTTTFCATLAAFYHKIPVAHVEAGLRTGNLSSPFPEEANRVLTSRLGTVHFAPTRSNRENLLAEGVAPEAIHVTGNTVIDALLLTVAKLEQNDPAFSSDQQTALLDRIPAPLVLVTAHRRENFGAGLRSICRALLKLAENFPGVHFVYPVHLNPNVGKTVHEILGNCGRSNLHLLGPLPYLPFVKLLNRSTLVLTDSGGIQEEAPSLGKPVLVLRDTTERPEAIQAGTARLVGSDSTSIFDHTARLLTDPDAYQEMARARNPYGDGRSAQRISDLCCRLLGLDPP